MHSAGNLTVSERDLVYIFTLPPPSVFNCSSSTVVGFQFCYRARNSDVRKSNHRKVFDFLSLVLSSSNDSFTVNARYSIWSTAHDNRCTPTTDGFQICCQRINNYRTHFPMPLSFGVVMQTFQLVTFAESNVEYVAEQYQLSLSGNLNQATKRDMVIAINENRAEKSLLLLRIFIGNDKLAIVFYMLSIM